MTDYGEPWQVLLISSGGAAMSKDLRDRNGLAVDLDRAIACTNACRGLEDPEAAIVAARDQLGFASGYFSGLAGNLKMGIRFCNPAALEAMAEKCLAAMKLLSPEKPTV